MKTIGNIFALGCATRENITDGGPLDEIFRSFTEKTNILYLFGSERVQCGLNDGTCH